MSNDIIQRVNCIETPSGYLLTWDTAEDVHIVRTTIYGINGAREFVIESPIVCTGRFVLDPRNYSLLNAFKVSVVTDEGFVEVSDPVVPQTLVKTERLLLKDMRRRFDVYVKSTPIGSYKCTLLLRRVDGPGCTNCGSKVCSGHGGGAVSDYCPVCLGTGVKDPYYVYPKDILVHAVSPRDDNDVIENPAVQRSHITRVFQSTFDLQLKENDVLVTGTEAYRIMKQTVSASVGNAPVVFNLECIKYAPEDPRYPTFMELAAGADHDCK
jgi:hypothetical protein